MPNTDPKKKRRRDVAFATVIQAAGPKNWVIRRDIDGEVKIVSSRSLKVVPADCGVPLADNVVTNANNEATNEEAIHVSIVNFGFVISILTFYFFLVTSDRKRTDRRTRKSRCFRGRGRSWWKR